MAYTKESFCRSHQRFRAPAVRAQDKRRGRDARATAGETPALPIRRRSVSKSRYLFTSESVTEGHPDKIADQISDSILDAILAQDPVGRVACETLVTTGLAIIAGEITTKAYVDFQALVRGVIAAIRYN